MLQGCSIVDYGPKLALSAEPWEPEARHSYFTLRELAETRTRQIEDCGCGAREIYDKFAPFFDKKIIRAKGGIRFSF
jgi:hypothetical protein